MIDLSVKYLSSMSCFLWTQNPCTLHFLYIEHLISPLVEPPCPNFSLRGRYSFVLITPRPFSHMTQITLYNFTANLSVSLLVLKLCKDSICLFSHCMQKVQIFYLVQKKLIKIYSLNWWLNGLNGWKNVLDRPGKNEWSARIE